MLIDKQELEVSESASIIGFSTEGGGAWKIWDRYLTVGGKNAYHIGNICNTCAFFFERLEGANQSVNAQEVADALNDGVSELSPVFRWLGLHQFPPIFGDKRVKLRLIHVRKHLKEAV